MSVERTIARLLGVDGANELDAPLPNVLVDHVRDRGELGKGIAYWLGNALLADPDATPQSIAEAVDAGELDLIDAAARRRDDAIGMRVMRECEQRIMAITQQTCRSATSCAIDSASHRRRFATC